MTIIRDLNGITVGELKTILENIPNDIEVCIWGPNVDCAEIEVNAFENKEFDVFINIETLSSY